MALRADRAPTPGIELTLADAEQLPSTNLLIKILVIINLLIKMVVISMIMVNLILITMMRMVRM